METPLAAWSATSLDSAGETGVERIEGFGRIRQVPDAISNIVCSETSTRDFEPCHKTS